MSANVLCQCGIDVEQEEEELVNNPDEIADTETTSALSLDQRVLMYNFLSEEFPSDMEDVGPKGKEENNKNYTVGSYEKNLRMAFPLATCVCFKCVESNSEMAFHNKTISPWIVCIFLN